MQQRCGHERTRFGNRVLDCGAMRRQSRSDPTSFLPEFTRSRVGSAWCRARSHLGRAWDGRPATMKITPTITIDSPDGRQCPQPDRDVLWVVVRRADDCTVWRSIQLTQVRSAATDFAILQ